MWVKGAFRPIVVAGHGLVADTNDYSHQKLKKCRLCERVTFCHPDSVLIWQQNARHRMISWNCWNMLCNWFNLKWKRELILYFAAWLHVIIALLFWFVNTQRYIVCSSRYYRIRSGRTFTLPNSRLISWWRTVILGCAFFLMILVNFCIL